MRQPHLRDFIVPSGIVFGALVGLCIALIDLPSAGAVKALPGDPGEGTAMLAMFYMFAGAIAGAFVGVVLALTLYFKRRQSLRLK
jgi:membrane associated rhomboid family serine protease